MVEGRRHRLPLKKELGTSCVHLPQTHAIVKVLRLVAEALDPNFKILTETNVPLAENLSYFDGDEANIVYNFYAPTSSSTRS